MVVKLNATMMISRYRRVAHQPLISWKICQAHRRTPEGIGQIPVLTICAGQVLLAIFLGTAIFLRDQDLYSGLDVPLERQRIPQHTLQTLHRLHGYVQRILGCCSVRAGGPCDALCHYFSMSSALLRCSLPDSEFTFRLLPASDRYPHARGRRFEFRSSTKKEATRFSMASFSGSVGQFL